MITDIDLIAFDFMSDYKGVEKYFPTPFYPSGVYEKDKTQYQHGPQSSEYPNLTLPCELHDEWGNVIPDGYYMVVLSDDMKYLELYQSNNIKARVKVIKVIEQMFTQEELDEEAEIVERLNSAKANKKLKKFSEAEQELIAFKERNAANSFAEISDSGKGYYILTYNYNGKRAVGIIQK